MAIQIDWIIISQILTAIVALGGLGLSIYSLVRKKPKISLEKVSAKKEGEKIIEFTFYLDNIGETATTIKSIKLYNSKRFMPHARFASIKDYYKVVDEEIEEGEGSEKWFELPMHILPNTSIKIFAQLEFPDKEHRDASIVDGQIHFNVIVRHSKGKIDYKV